MAIYWLIEVESYDGCILVCYLNNDFKVKSIKKQKGKITLLPKNPNYKPVEVSGKKTLAF